MDNTEKTLSLLRRLRREMNGAVTEAMSERGMDYGLNYGVAIPVIRKAAREWAPDHSFALHLFRQDVRELKLSAVYIDDPAEVTMGQAMDWEQAVVNNELAEHVSMFLFAESPVALDIAARWLESVNPLLNKGGLHIVGRMVQKGNFAVNDASRVMPLVHSVVFSARPYLHNAAVYALKNLASALPCEVSEMMLAMKCSAGKHVSGIAEEVEALMAV